MQHLPDITDVAEGKMSDPTWPAMVTIMQSPNVQFPLSAASPGVALVSPAALPATTATTTTDRAVPHPAVIAWNDLKFITLLRSLITINSVYKIRKQ